MRHELVDGDRRRACRESHDREARSDVAKDIRPAFRSAERNLERRRHGRADGFSIQRIASRRRQQHRIGSKRRGVAEHAADVVRIADGFERNQPARSAEER